MNIRGFIFPNYSLWPKKLKLGGGGDPPKRATGKDIIGLFYPKNMSKLSEEGMYSKKTLSKIVTAGAQTYVPI